MSKYGQKIKAVKLEPDLEVAKGDEVIIVGGTYVGNNGWVNVSAANGGYTSKMVHLLLLDEANKLRKVRVMKKYVK